VVPRVQRSQDTEDIKQGVVGYLEKGATITAKYYECVALLDKLKQQLSWSLKVEASFRKEFLFLQDSAAPHKEAITHKNWQIFTLKF
jgi:hypothetical protein